MTNRVFETPWFAVDEIPARPEWGIGSSPFYRITCEDHVLTIPVTGDGSFIMVRQYRPARNGFTLEFPAGGIERGESPERAAGRELLEETGYKAAEWVSVGRSGLANHRENADCHVFAAFGLSKSQPAVEQGVETVIIRPEELRQLALENRMDMLVSLGALCFARILLGDRIPAF
ncbi:NUDIX hydrolase (plasmid) [Azospirillum sp. TSA2s]|uniref:NUDIX hydrolase n=1 Tax=Azospirillum sp. TSA2s TaxID=709810 RepID=UPI0010AADE46|nr:NUDIX hydrolase [Azospirillum sp. TSA2s]QCG93159.1 NUDIX hydrolase [Azospirillum sp. TSA2s]